MLNLEFPFQDACLAIAEASEHLQVAPLAAAVYLMQRDVINQYQYALEHYLTVNLSASFLQNSSLGTPYQKWAKFTNRDFEGLFFSIGNLLRYTARLLDETLAAKQHNQQNFSESKATSSLYISQLVAIRDSNHFIGVRCEQDPAISITPLEDIGRPGQASSKARSLRIDTEPVRIEVLQQVRSEGEAEIQRMTAFHETFSALCRRYYDEHDVIAPYDGLHPSYCM